MKKNWLIGIFIFICLTCSALLLPKPTLTGDGIEYLTMCVSFKNHHSFDRQNEDISTVRKTLMMSSSDIENSLKYGYFKPLREGGGGQYSYHFWAYPLICSPAFLILSLFKLNLLYAFQITNLLLILLMFYWILFRNNAMSYKSKVFLTTLLYFSPLWFYYKWTHPEVYTFTFLMIGLIDYYNKRKASAIFFTAMSSLQNPAAAIVPFFMMIKEIVVLCKNFSKTALYKFISYGLISLTVFIPYMFYYYHFNTFSLIGKYATDIHSISFAKIFSLFFDLNFGLIIYAPVIFLLAIYGTIKKDKLAISSLFIVILFAVIDAAQLNWNPGIQLIHRYSYWMIPVLLFGSFNIIKQFTDKTKCIILIINAILILPWFIYTTTSHAVSQVRFQPVAKTVLNTFPQLYNPQEEIFAERAFGEEGVLGDKENLPISYYENDKILKSLHYDIEKNKYYYKNYNQNLLDLKIKIKHKQYIYYVGLKGIKKELKNEKIHKTSEN